MFALLSFEHQPFSSCPSVFNDLRDWTGSSSCPVQWLVRPDRESQSVSQSKSFHLRALVSNWLVIDDFVRLCCRACSELWCMDTNNNRNELVQPASQPTDERRNVEARSWSRFSLLALASGSLFWLLFAQGEPLNEMIIDFINESESLDDDDGKETWSSNSILWILIQIPSFVPVSTSPRIIWIRTSGEEELESARASAKSV